MKIYIAAPWVDRDLAREAAQVVRAAGFEISEPWWDHEDVAGYGKENISETDFAELNNQAYADIAGVFASDAMVLINTQKSEGKAVEFGLRLMDPDYPVVLVGKRTNLFHYLLPDSCLVDDVESAVEFLKGIDWEE